MTKCKCNGLTWVPSFPPSLSLSPRPLGTQTHTLPIQKCWDLSSSLQDQLACYCLSVCASSLLHDAESHHWADPKPFYEVRERCFGSVLSSGAGSG